MARDISMEGPLSWEDREYLAMRGAWGDALITRLDQAFPPSEADAERWANRNVPGAVTTGDTALLDENARLRQALRDAGVPLPGEEPDEDVEYDDRPYSAWTAKELKDELKTRSLPVSGTVEEMAARLTEFDASQAAS